MITILNYITEENRIRIIIGNHFGNLKALKEVNLQSNWCIDEEFTASNGNLSAIDAVIQVKCHGQRCEGSTDQVARISQLQTELVAAREAKIQAERQTALLGEVYSKLEAQANETFEAKMELKLKEIHDLSDDLIEKTSKINDMNDQIKMLQKKVEAWSGQQW